MLKIPKAMEQEGSVEEAEKEHMWIGGKALVTVTCDMCPHKTVEIYFFSREHTLNRRLDHDLNHLLFL